MGREIKRVQLDFNWPMGMPWKGYMSPYRPQKCKACDGSGMNPETKQISDDWYDFAGTGRRWCCNITQDEVDALIERGRLYDFTHRRVGGKGWQPIDPPPAVTAEMVNEWARRGMGHDSLNHWICTETRAKRLGVFGNCLVCSGEGQIWFSDRIKELANKWYGDERYGPPEGEGWQLWETTSEGSPISPVFATADEMIDYLIEQGYSSKAAEKFVKVDKWAMSGMMVNGEFYKDIESSGIDDR